MASKYGRRYTNAQKREMVSRYIAGETMSAIATDIGCSTNTIWKTVNKHFRGELALEDNERNDTMNIEEKNIETKETPAAVGAATDVSTNLNVDRRSDSPYSYDTTYGEFCQALLTQIVELADNIIADDGADAEVSGYAGMIKGLATAMREVMR